MYSHVKLNLPPVELKTRKESGKVYVWDMVRKKHVVLTPEEWVRQHFVHFLINELAYPRSLFRIEGGLQYNRLNKRTDIVIRDRAGDPWMLVECKAPSVKLSQAAFNQIALYNMSVGAKFLAVTNGLVHYCYRVSAGKTGFMAEFPPFAD